MNQGSLVQGGGDGTPLQSSRLENPMVGGAWWAAVHGVAKGQTQLSDFTFTSNFHALEKEMATHSSVLAQRIPGTESLVGCHLWGRIESDRLQRLSSNSRSSLVQSMLLAVCYATSRKYNACKYTQICCF